MREVGQYCARGFLLTQLLLKFLLDSYNLNIFFEKILFGPSKLFIKNLPLPIYVLFYLFEIFFFGLLTLEILLYILKIYLSFLQFFIHPIIILQTIF